MQTKLNVITCVLLLTDLLDCLCDAHTLRAKHKKEAKNHQRFIIMRLLYHFYPLEHSYVG